MSATKTSMPCKHWCPAIDSNGDLFIAHLLQTYIQDEDKNKCVYNIFQLCGFIQLNDVLVYIHT